MGAYVAFEGDGGHSVLVEVDPPIPERLTRGAQAPVEAITQAEESLERVIGRLGPMVRGLVSELQSSGNWPSEVQIEFAVRVSADANLIITRAGGEANFRIALRWSAAASRD